MLTRPKGEIIVRQGEEIVKGILSYLYILTAVKMYFVLKGLKEMSYFLTSL